VSEYSSKDIFDADGFRLFFSLLPDKPMLLKMKAVRGTRRVMIKLLCLYVQIRMDLKRCLCWYVESQRSKGASQAYEVLCTYRHKGGACITCMLLIEFLTCLERRVTAKNGKILLLLDHCA
jgi:hypothetical protein